MALKCASEERMCQGQKPQDQLSRHSWPASPFGGIFFFFFFWCRDSREPTPDFALTGRSVEVWLLVPQGE